MLTTCPECNREVSDKAEACPHCGYPFTKKPRKYVRHKRRRLPNGFGQISEIKGRNLKNPYRAMVTIDKNIYGKPICALLKPQAYFHTYNEAYEALLEYNRTRGVYFTRMTMADLYAEWFSKYQEGLSESRIKSIKHYWKHCYPVYEIGITELTIKDIKACIATTDSYNYKMGVKIILNKMLGFAVEHEYLARNIMREVDVSLEMKAPETNHHISYQDSEMALLWENISQTGMILVQCYMGWRPSELLNIRLTDCNLRNWTITGGMKTKAGIGRVVPIHPRIREIICSNYASSQKLGSEYLFSNKSQDGHFTKFSASAYERKLGKIVESLGLNPDHTPHDARKQFITMAKRDGVDEYAIKRIVGHQIKDITENVYTDRDIEWLREQMEKIT